MFEELVEPVKDYLSKGNSKFPLINEERVMGKYGVKVLNQVRDLRNELYKSEANRMFNGNNWETVERIFRDDCLKKYSSCCGEIIELFWWGYSWCIYKGSR